MVAALLLLLTWVLARSSLGKATTCPTMLMQHVLDFAPGAVGLLVALCPLTLFLQFVVWKGLSWRYEEEDREEDDIDREQRIATSREILFCTCAALQWVCPIDPTALHGVELSPRPALEAFGVRAGQGPNSTPSMYICHVILRVFILCMADIMLSPIEADPHPTLCSRVNGHFVVVVLGRTQLRGGSWRQYFGHVCIRAVLLPAWVRSELHVGHARADGRTHTGNRCRHRSARRGRDRETANVRDGSVCERFSPPTRARADVEAHAHARGRQQAAADGAWCSVGGVGGTISRCPAVGVAVESGHTGVLPPSRG